MLPLLLQRVTAELAKTKSILSPYRAIFTFQDCFSQSVILFHFPKERTDGCWQVKPAEEGRAYLRGSSCGILVSQVKALRVLMWAVFLSIPVPLPAMTLGEKLRDIQKMYHIYWNLSSHTLLSEPTAPPCAIGYRSILRLQEMKQKAKGPVSEFQGKKSH